MFDKPSEVYRCGEKHIAEMCKVWYYRPVDFRTPKSGEIYIAAPDGDTLLNGSAHPNPARGSKRIIVVPTSTHRKEPTPDELF